MSEDTDQIKPAPAIAPKTTLLHTLSTNARDFGWGLGIILFAAFAVDGAEKLATTVNGLAWLTNLSGALGALSRFLTGNLFLWIGVTVAWPTMNHFSNHKFSDAWEALSLKEQFFAFLLVCAIMCHMAAAAISGIPIK